MTQIEQMSLEAGIIVEFIGGDLRVRGHSGNALRIEGDDPEIIHETTAAPVVIRCEGDCSIRMPEAARLAVQQVGDDATITNLENNNLTIGQIGSDLAVRHVIGDITVDRVGGDFQAKHIVGNLTIQAVGSDIDARKISGDLVIHHVGSDISLRDIGGNCDCQDVDGDLLVETAFDPDATYRFGAESDVCFIVNVDTAAVFLVPIHTEITIDDDVDATVEELEDSQRVTVGEDGPGVEITAATELLLTVRRGFNLDIDIDLGERMGRLEERLNESLSGLGDMIEMQVQQGLSQASEVFQGWSDRSKVKSATRRAERARRHAERQAARARRHVERVQHHTHRQQDADDWEPPSNEERMMILQMVEQGKISVEEADQLLRALDGN